MTAISRATASLIVCLLSNLVLAQEPGTPRWTLTLDNDQFVTGRDADYTGGATISYAKDQTTATQLGVMIYTPENISEPNPIADDRPYANLVFASRSTTRLNFEKTILTQDVKTIGLLGTNAGELVQSGVHEITDSTEPQGFNNQISDGGEITARWSKNRLQLVQAGDRAQWITQFGGSIGYLTEAHVGIGFRWGRLRSSWLKSAEEMSSAVENPAGYYSSKPGDLYLFGGLRARARLYNALLQGQVRDSAVTFDFSELNHGLVDAWLGIATHFRGYGLRYTVNFQSRELRRGQGARNLIWAGITVSHPTPR